MCDIVIWKEESLGEGVLTQISPNEQVESDSAIDPITQAARAYAPSRIKLHGVMVGCNWGTAIWVHIRAFSMVDAT